MASGTPRRSEHLCAVLTEIKRRSGRRSEKIPGRLQQERKRCLATVFEFERQQIVGARPAEVDGGDRDAAACSSLCEAEPGIDQARSRRQSMASAPSKCAWVA